MLESKNVVYLHRQFPPRLSTMRTRAELLLFMNKYQKLPLTLECQLDTLRRRGLIIEDYDYACDQLSKIGYFRLANYWRPMEKDKKSHLFKPYSKFSNSVSLYYFDKELRVLLFSAIQSIEVSFRAKVMHEVAMVYGSFWIMNPCILYTSPRPRDGL
ncbi:MAG: Abi family protein, partial [Muribaculaceae bacterium]|nr:Abi family protein [Muribaculaceae bacterium]